MARTLNTTALYLQLRKENRNMKPAHVWLVACYRTAA
jgi:hypothetical protein